jgi:hypothetical protein
MERGAGAGSARYGAGNGAFRVGVFLHPDQCPTCRGLGTGVQAAAGGATTAS